MGSNVISGLGGEEGSVVIVLFVMFSSRKVVIRVNVIHGVGIEGMRGE